MPLNSTQVFGDSLNLGAKSKFFSNCSSGFLSSKSPQYECNDLSTTFDEACNSRLRKKHETDNCNSIFSFSFHETNENIGQKRSRRKYRARCRPLPRSIGSFSFDGPCDLQQTLPQESCCCRGVAVPCFCGILRKSRVGEQRSLFPVNTAMESSSASTIVSEKRHIVANHYQILSMPLGISHSIATSPSCWKFAGRKRLNANQESNAQILSVFGCEQEKQRKKASADPSITRSRKNERLCGNVLSDISNREEEIDIKYGTARYSSPRCTEISCKGRKSFTKYILPGGQADQMSSPAKHVASQKALLRTLNIKAPRVGGNFKESANKEMIYACVKQTEGRKGLMQSIPGFALVQRWVSRGNCKSAPISPDSSPPWLSPRNSTIPDGTQPLLQQSRSNLIVVSCGSLEKKSSSSTEDQKVKAGSGKHAEKDGCISRKKTRNKSFEKKYLGSDKLNEGIRRIGKEELKIKFPSNEAIKGVNCKHQEVSSICDQGCEQGLADGEMDDRRSCQVLERLTNGRSYCANEPDANDSHYGLIPSRGSTCLNTNLLNPKEHVQKLIESTNSPQCRPRIFKHEPFLDCQTLSGIRLGAPPHIKPLVCSLKKEKSGGSVFSDSTLCDSIESLDLSRCSTIDSIDPCNCSHSSFKQTSEDFSSRAKIQSWEKTDNKVCAQFAMSRHKASPRLLSAKVSTGQRVLGQPQGGFFSGASQVLNPKSLLPEDQRCFFQWIGRDGEIQELWTCYRKKEFSSFNKSPSFALNLSRSFLHALGIDVQDRFCEAVAFKTIRMLKLCSYETEDILRCVALAVHQLANMKNRVVTADATEAAYVGALQIYLAHCWLLDVTCPIIEWYKHIFFELCSFSALNDALMTLFKTQDFHLSSDSVQVHSIMHQLAALVPTRRSYAPC